MSLLIMIAAILTFLVVEAVPAIRADTTNILLTQDWNPDGTPARFGVATLAYGTVVSSVLALVMATPVAVGAALFIAHYAPRRLAGLLGSVVDLLAAVPSVVYGLWGLLVLVPLLTGPEGFLHDKLGWFPPFGGPVVAGRSLFTASVLLAIMILPIIAAISREVFLTVPREHQEAALALGATRWEMIRLAVLPYGRSGVISAALLGLGRALGETVAVALVLSSTYQISPHILGPGGNTFAANIANTFGMAGPTGRAALIASGLFLFVITVAVTMLTRVVRAPGGGTRRRSPIRFARLGFTRRLVPRRVANQLAAGAALGAFLLAVAPLLSVLATVVGHGLRRFDLTFLTHSMRGVGALDPGGGAYHAILGTLEQVSLASILAVPAGLLTAIYLSEYGRGRLARSVAFAIDVLSGLPSIVAGLFILVGWVLALGRGFSGFAGALALAILMLPMVVRSADEMLRLVPHPVREASLALGIPRWRTVVHVLLPTAAPGILTGVLLAVARVVGETAPLLLTTFFTQSINANPWHGPQVGLPEFVFDQAARPNDTAVSRAWTGAMTLILIVLLMNLVARVLVRRRGAATKR